VLNNAGSASYMELSSIPLTVTAGVLTSLIVGAIRSLEADNSLR